MRAMTAAHWNADDDFTLGSDTTNDTLAEYRPEDLDEEYNFELKTGQSVWVKFKGEQDTWCQGVVMKGRTTRPVRHGKEGIFYRVKYRHNLRRYFSPLLGDIKPDIPEVVQLLKDAGVLCAQ